MRPHVSRRVESDLDVFETHFLNLLPQIPRDGTTVDLQPIFTDLALDIVTHIFLGRSTAVLNRSADHERGQRFANAHTLAQHELLFGDFSMVELLKRVFGNAKRNRHAQEANEILYAMVEEEAARISMKSDDEDRESVSFAEAALREGRTVDEIKRDLMNLITAGKDTTSAVLGSIWFSLARDRDVFRKLQEEVASLGQKAPTLAQLSQLKYLKLVINESKSIDY